MIDAFAVRNIAAFINFSCDPNLEMKGIASASGDGRIKRVGFFARRVIHAGDELCYRRDKNAVSARSRHGSARCFCGATNCMGKV